MLAVSTLFCSCAQQLLRESPTSSQEQSSTEQTPSSSSTRPSKKILSNSFRFLGVAVTDVDALLLF